MTTVKRITDLANYTNVLPYASELFGVYQPLLGWKSVRLKRRFDNGFRKDKGRLLKALLQHFSSESNLKIDSSGKLTVETTMGEVTNLLPTVKDSVVLQTISKKLPSGESPSPELWTRLLNPDTLQTIIKTVIPDYYSQLFAKRREYADAKNIEERRTLISFQKQIEYETNIAGMLQIFFEKKYFALLQQLFYGLPKHDASAELISQMIGAEDSVDAFLNLENIDATEASNLKNVLVSPISVIHLFRQYFFELDTFLGTPESHVWLSPGAKVVLVEETTDRTLTERTFERSLDVFSRTESEESIQEEFSDAISIENSSNVNYGASVTADYSRIEATASFDYASSQSNAREKTHRTMRDQSEKVSSESRKKNKTTFRSVSEVTEFNHTKHILANETPNLVNYELRRKMRQVGIQVQDIGTYLCWQTYVDDPGKELGLAKLLHIAKSPELDNIQSPDAVPVPEKFSESKTITIPLIPVGGGADNKNEIYVDGLESDDNDERGFDGSGDLEKIETTFPQKVVCSKSGYKLRDIEFDSMGNPISVSLIGDVVTPENGEGKFTLYVDSVDFQGQNSVQIKLILHWVPTSETLAEVEAQNQAKINEFREDERQAYETAFIETARDRINAAAGINSRKSEDLREEERILVYRKLIQDLLLNKVELPDSQTHHVAAELINSIFDVEKMLYFVAPEWWRPRLHKGKQQLFPKSKPKRRTVQSSGLTSKISTDVVIADKVYDESVSGPLQQSSFDDNTLIEQTTGWGEIEEDRRDNYYITENSDLARFGSSLGWLLQLDGDNRRNAFLNAPWVKAVIPIRPGKEKAAINWLQAVEGTNGIEEDAIYQSDNPNEVDVDGVPLDGQNMITVLYDLAEKIKRKHESALKTDTFPKPTEVSDPAMLDGGNTVSSVPIDRVYEHGFFPLEKSFRSNVEGDYEIFDQWIEILPTDQIVPVEVEYDPKTGRQV